MADDSWGSGLKTLSTPKKRASGDRWDLENSKVIPNEGVGRVVAATKRDIVRQPGWESGAKVLEKPAASRRSRSVGDSPRSECASSATGATGASGRASPSHDKSIPRQEPTFKIFDIPSGWAVENSKTMGPRKPRERIGRNTYDKAWRPDSKVLKERVMKQTRHYTPSQVPFGPSSGEAMPPAPGDGNWLCENFKVLPASGRNSPASVRCRTPTGSDNGSAGGDPWDSGLKTLVEPPQRLYKHSWADESNKTLPRGGPDAEPPAGKNTKKKEIVRIGGWDSGLYKTLPRDELTRQQQAAQAPREGWQRNKVMPRQVKQKKELVIENTGWDSGLYKTLKTTRPKPQAATATPTEGDRPWSAGAKTLEPEEMYFAGSRKAYQRHVALPRKRDMWAFHSNLTERRKSTGA